MEGSEAWVIHQLVVSRARPRFEAMWLKLVVSKLPQLVSPRAEIRAMAETAPVDDSISTQAGCPEIFDDFAPPDLGILPRPKDLKRCLRGLEDNYYDYIHGFDISLNDITDFRTKLQSDGNARGTLEYQYDVVKWRVKNARRGPVPPGVRVSRDSEGVAFQ